MKVPRAGDAVGSADHGVRGTWYWSRQLLFLCLGGMSLPGLIAGAAVIDFDDVATGVQPGSALAVGVTLSTGEIPNDLHVGDVIMFSNAVDGVEVLDKPEFAPSPPHYIIPQGGLLNDVLITFVTPVTSVSVSSDFFDPEERDVIRLVALEPAGAPNQFRVLRFVEAYDDVFGPPDDVLTVDLDGAPFSYAVFQCTTELEGFDDLTFTPVESAPADGEPSNGDPVNPDEPAAGGGDSSPSGAPVTPETPSDSATNGGTPGTDGSGSDDGLAPGSDAGPGGNSVATVAGAPCLCPAGAVAMFGLVCFGMSRRGWNRGSAARKTR